MFLLAAAATAVHMNAAAVGQFARPASAAAAESGDTTHYIIILLPALFRASTLTA